MRLQGLGKEVPQGPRIAGRFLESKRKSGNRVSEIKIEQRIGITMACSVGSIKHLKDRKTASMQCMKGYHSRAGFMVKLLKVDNL